MFFKFLSLWLLITLLNTQLTNTHPPRHDHFEPQQSREPHHGHNRHHHHPHPPNHPQPPFPGPDVRPGFDMRNLNGNRPNHPQPPFPGPNVRPGFDMRNLNGNRPNSIPQPGPRGGFPPPQRPKFDPSPIGRGNSTFNAGTENKQPTQRPSQMQGKKPGNSNTKTDEDQAIQEIFNTNPTQLGKIGNTGNTSKDSGDSQSQRNPKSEFETMTFKPRGLFEIQPTCSEGKVMIAGRCRSPA